MLLGTSALQLGYNVLITDLSIGYNPLPQIAREAPNSPGLDAKMGADHFQSQTHNFESQTYRGEAVWATTPGDPQQTKQHETNDYLKHELEHGTHDLDELDSAVDLVTETPNEKFLEEQPQPATHGEPHGHRDPRQAANDNKPPGGRGPKEITEITQLQEKQEIERTDQASEMAERREQLAEKYADSPEEVQEQYLEQFDAAAKAAEEALAAQQAAELQRIQELQQIQQQHNLQL